MPPENPSEGIFRGIRELSDIEQSLRTQIISLLKEKFSDSYHYNNDDLRSIINMIVGLSNAGCEVDLIFNSRLTAHELKKRIEQEHRKVFGKNNPSAGLAGGRQTHSHPLRFLDEEQESPIDD